MKCHTCGAAMKSARGAHRYTESGLPNVVLLNVERRTCPKCGESALVIPRMEELHRMIADAVSQSPAKLSPQEIRFLRKWLGFSSTDFALMMGVRPETVSRWESVEHSYSMSQSAERLLRVLVANQEPVSQYPISLFRMQPKVKPQMFKFTGPDWKQAAS